MDGYMTINLPSIPGYTILKVAGTGGMGVVYQAQQTQTGRVVAIKVLTKGDAAALDRFRHEASTIARLEHPNILPVYDFGTVNEQPYLVMRYLDGGSVADRLMAGPLTEATAVILAAKVADALDLAHQSGIVHRDVKPANMLLDERGNVYLTDFGLAGTGAGQVGQGSVAYMAPEQAQGQITDGRADLYALAVALFEMVTGSKPYTAETTLGVMVRHQSDPIPSVRTVNPQVSLALDDLIQWGMAKKPGERPGSAAAFAHLLQQSQRQPDQPLPRPSQVATEVGLAAMELGLGRTEVAAPPLREGVTQPVAEGVMARKDDGVRERPVETRPGGRTGPSAGVVLVGVLVVVVLIGVFVVGRGMFAAATPTPPIPTVTSLPPTATTALTPTPEGQLLMDDFRDPFAGFGIKADEDGGVAYENEHLLFTSRRNGVFWFSLSERLNVADVQVTVDATFVEGITNVEMGVICRWQDVDNFVALTVNPSGSVMLWQRLAGTITTLAEGDAAAFTPGTMVELQVICQGENVQLGQNGVVLLAAATTILTPGDVALLTRQRAEGELTVTFDNIVVRNVE